MILQSSNTGVPTIESRLFDCLVLSSGAGVQDSVALPYIMSLLYLRHSWTREGRAQVSEDDQGCCRGTLADTATRTSSVT